MIIKGAPLDGSARTPGLGHRLSNLLQGDSALDHPRLLRSGSWGHDPRDCRSAYRGRYHPVNRFNHWGFLVCCLPQDLLLYP